MWLLVFIDIYFYIPIEFDIEDDGVRAVVWHPF